MSTRAGGRRLAAWWSSLPSERVTQRGNYIWLVVATVCVGAFMAALDASIVNVALPDLGSYYHAGSTVGWVLISYLLTLATLLTLFGRLADMVGRKPLYTLGFLIFIIGSAACGAAVSMTMLIIARVFQAAGAAMLQANSVAIITAAVPSNMRGRAIGFQGSAQAIGLSVGPAVGGALIGLFGWRAIFYVNVPVGILGTLAGALILPKDFLKKTSTVFDWVGTALFSPILVAVMLALEEGDSWGWGSAKVIGLFATAAVLTVLFVLWEGHAKSPLIHLKLFKIPVFSIGNFTGLLSYLVMFGVLVLMPYYFERISGYPSALVGLVMTPVPLGMTVAAPTAGRLADQYGPRMLTTLGMALAALGAFLVSITVGLQTNVVLLVVELLMVGVGLGVFTPPNNSSVMGSLPSERLGVGGGILNMARSLGMAMGTAVSLTILAALLAARGGSLSGVGSHRAWIPALHETLLVLVGLSLLASALSVLRTSSPKQDRDDNDRAEMAMIEI
ncbi:MAG: DHA2 family efflux MFS transporter permease subunit [Firmicutes bacterium]|nr:DHA2 family efflux MFS transporter permease subunit [Bacillota bacterium]MCL5066167.1 DHA2 family efflux MFS transporter permease subunit [Bacillota bacterium]